MKKTPKNILVIRLSAMGDVAMVVPVLKALTHTYPDLKITVLSKPFFKPIFNDINNLQFISAQVKKEHQGALGLLKLAKQLKGLKVDAVADLHNVLRSKFINCFLKYNGINTASLDKGRKQKKALTKANNKKLIPLKSTQQRYADVFAKLGLSIDLETPHFLPQRKLPKIILPLFKEKTLKKIGVAPFAAYNSKTYPLLLMREVLKQLNKKEKYQIFLFGSIAEKEALINLASNLNQVTTIAGILSFEEELALISNLELMIAMDSGNGHLAAMFGMPVVTLWGVTHPYLGFTPFKQPLENQIMADRNKFQKIPTSVYGNKFPKGYDNVMQTIKPDTIVKKAEEILNPID